VIGIARAPVLARCALLLGVLAVSGCGGGGSTHSTGTTPSSGGLTVSTTQVADGIKTDLSTSSVKVTSVNCPSEVPVQQGATFTCSVSLSNGGTGNVDVTQEGANRYTYAFAPGSVQIPGTAAATAIQESLAAQGVPNAKVTCPESIIVKLGTTVTCEVSGAKGAAAGTVTYTFSEANGTVDPASVKTS
jgi:uncharacterized protein DUF4333